jgi:hypothetical protein
VFERSVEMVHLSLLRSANPLTDTKKLFDHFVLTLNLVAGTNRNNRQRSGRHRGTSSLFKSAQVAIKVTDVFVDTRRPTAIAIVCVRLCVEHNFDTRTRHWFRKSAGHPAAIVQ